MRTASLRTGALAVALLLALPLTAQTDWRLRAGGDRPRLGHAMAFDLVNARTLLFGGLDTSSFQSVPIGVTQLGGSRPWSTPTLTVEPPPRAYHAMASDLLRSRVVLFGGFANNTSLGDTWEWDGAQWTQVANGPPARHLTAMAADLARGRVVLFGGLGSGAGSATFNDVWEWDGAAWTQAAPPTVPAPRFGHGMSYDPARNRIVVAGGLGPQGPGPTLEWDGQVWSTPNLGAEPPASRGPMVTYDFAHNRTLMLTEQPGDAAGELWSWDGSTWTLLVPAAGPRPSARTSSALSFDIGSGTAVVFGGSDGNTYGDTWEWNGTAWSTSAPPPRRAAAMAFDAGVGRGVLFGGLIARQTTLLAPTANDTWLWDDGTWQLAQPPVSPPPRQGHTLAYDDGRQRVVLFGGSAPWTPIGDTWEWDGATWSQVQPTTSPPPRTRAAMTYDAVRQRIVLFGGQGTGGQLDDTWLFDGADWNQVATASAPVARSGAAMTFDTARGRAVLFGGFSIAAGGIYLAQTHEWDGATWQLMPSTTGPTGRDAAVLVFDRARARSVLFGGLGIPTNEPTWEWDGAIWRSRPTPALATAAAEAAGCFDRASERAVVVGGQSTALGPFSQETWDYGPIQPAAVLAYGTGCAGSSGLAVLRADGDSRPWIGASFALTVEPVPTNAPVLFAIGFSRSTVAGVPLPLPLDGLGMPGCTLFASLDLSGLTTAVGSRATQSLTVPADPSLRGASFYCQAGVADPAANATGLVVTDALDCTIGAK